MIPKKIHYCWFGRGEKPKLAQKCIASWKKYCPDYEIVEWNEDNFDIFAYPYAQYCYQQKKWAFLSDFVRLVVVEKYGGIYFDTDVELVKNPDFLLEHEAFYGFVNHSNVNTGQGFGAEAHSKTIRAMMRTYLKLEPRKQEYPMVPCPQLNTQALIPFGLQLNGELQEIDGATVYSEEFFNPFENATGRLKRTERTISIHWYSKSWISKPAVIRAKIMRPIHRIFGCNLFRKA